MTTIMEKKSKIKPLLLNERETLGNRIARLRKERGYSQAGLAEKMGTIQRLISDYERDKLRPHPDMLIQFALALEVSSDELLGLKECKNNGAKPNKKILNRMKKIEGLPLSQQKFVLRTIDSLLKASEK